MFPVEAGLVVPSSCEGTKPLGGNLAKQPKNKATVAGNGEGGGLCGALRNLKRSRVRA